MKKGWLIFLLISLSLTIGPAKQASAWNYTIGDDGWWNGTHYNLDKLEFFIISGGAFADPSQTNFTDKSWHATLANPQYSLATGSGVSSLFWTFHFADPYSGPITLDWLAYSGGTFLGDARVTFTGGSFSFYNLSDPPSYDRSAVPLPSTLLLLGSALVGLGLLKRRCPDQRHTREEIP